MYTFLPQHTYEKAFKYVWLCVDSDAELHIFTDACMSVTWLAIQAFKYPPFIPAPLGTVPTDRRTIP